VLKVLRVHQQGHKELKVMEGQQELKGHKEPIQVHKVLKDFRESQELKEHKVVIRVHKELKGFKGLKEIPQQGPIKELQDHKEDKDLQVQ
jgi:hypothetical protein